MSSAVLLTGDVGGTKTALARAEIRDDGRLVLTRRESYGSDSGGFEEILERFLEGEDRSAIRAAGFGIAGPVIDGYVRTTNLPWELEEGALRRSLGLPAVRLLNDLTAMALGMAELQPADLHTLQAGQARDRGGNVAVIAAGTGLGEAMLCWDGERAVPLSSEGGHGDFAPKGPEEIALLEYLSGDLGEHVSYERVLSGPGIVNLYRFLRESGREDESESIAEEMRREDAARVITRHALAQSDPLCVRTMERFVAVYGSEAGNLALRSTASGGVFLGGGIAPRILPLLERGGFMKRFLSKGRFRSFLERIPVRVACSTDAPLLGAARYAARHAAGG